MKNLTTAIFAKCAVGTDLYNDVAGKLFKARAPEGSEYPYIVFQVVSDVPEKTFSEEFENVVIQFSLFSVGESSVEVEDMFTDLKALYDECAFSITGSTLIWMKRANATLMIEDHTTKKGTIQVFHYAVDYDILTQLDD